MFQLFSFIIAKYKQQLYKYWTNKEAAIIFRLLCTIVFTFYNLFNIIKANNTFYASSSDLSKEVVRNEIEGLACKNKEEVKREEEDKNDDTMSVKQAQYFCAWILLIGIAIGVMLL